MEPAARPSPRDCLTLNVWTPAADDGRRPVLFWVHGGAFVTGAGTVPWYDGGNLTRRDIVVVTTNYRLGALGFLELGGIDASYADSGDCGLMDQIAALEWVRDNIAAFGGDPDNVTLAGESAGAYSVGALLGSPAAQGLFHKAIPQSGAAGNVSEPAWAEESTAKFLAALGVAGRGQEHQREAPGLDLLSPDLDQTEQFAVETQAGVEVANADHGVQVAHRQDSVANGRAFCRAQPPRSRVRGRSGRASVEPARRRGTTRWGG